MIFFSQKGMGLKERVLRAFQGLLTAPLEWPPRSCCLDFERLDSSEAAIGSILRRYRGAYFGQSVPSLSRV